MSVKQVLILLLISVVVSSYNINLDRRQNLISVDRIYFPDDTFYINKVSHDRKPIEDKVRCGRNEYLYPGDNLYDWTCDCKPGFVYYPKEGSCREVYRQGPCQQGEILISSNSLKSPICIVNKCKKDGLVEYNGKCQELDSPYPCQQFHYLVGRKTFLSVNPTTYELSCADADRFYECNGICCVNSRGIRDCFRSRRNTQKISKLIFTN